MTSTDGLCPQDSLDALLLRLEADGGVTEVEDLLIDYPADPRLHFLKGSLLASERRYEEAIATIARAVELAPDYEIARFQLGFLQFTSGDAGAAGDTWAPFAVGDPERPLAVFAAGLMALVADDTAGAIVTLERGIVRNLDYPVLNADIGLLVEALKREGGSPPEAPTSETDMLLWQFGQGSRH